MSETRSGENGGAIVQHFWDDRAARYDEAYDASGPGAYALRSRFDSVLSLVGPGPGDLLDAGMGPGRMCVALAERGWTVSGIDSSPEMVGLARKRLPAATERLICGSAEQVPFPERSFDAVTATGVLEYTHVPLAVGELARVLRPGGLAVISYPNHRALYSLWKTRIWYPAVHALKRVAGRTRDKAPQTGESFAPSAFVEVLERAGVSVEAVYFTAYLVLPAPLDDLVPRVSARLGALAERRVQRLGGLLATQALYVCRKSTRAPFSGGSRRDGRKG